MKRSLLLVALVAAAFLPPGRFASADRSASGAILLAPNNASCGWSGRCLTGAPFGWLGRSQARRHATRRPDAVLRW